MNIKIFETENKDINEKIENILKCYNKAFEEKVIKKDVSFVLEDKGELIGGLVGAIYGDYFEIDVLAIEKTKRKKGFGSQLLAEAENMLKIITVSMFFYIQQVIKGKLIILNLDLE